MVLSPKNIVVRMPNWLGDAVMASPVLQLLKQKFPDARLTLYGTKASLALFEHDPFVDHFLTLDKNKSGQLKIQELKDCKFDYGVLLTNSFSSAWLFFRAKIPTRLGFSKDMRGLFLTHSLPYPKDKSKMHHIELYQELLKRVGINKGSNPKLYLSDAEKMWATNFLSEHHIEPGSILIGVNPSAAFGSSKCWLEERFRELSIELLKHSSTHLLFFGDPSAKEKNERICSGLKNSTNLAGETSIRQLMALTQKCDLFLTNDSGPMHIACALDTPVVALFGSTSPEATGPYGRGVYLRKKVSCSPCYKRECPIDFRCMKAIKVQDVHFTIQNQLEKYKKNIAEID
ncbi:MAG: ADP-heptose--LPS heptosyltransferase 2 [Chlamydiae bacterium]|nr:ADP-heptose--LPS heptosyltransferase 2 [Chlamydiota bacterium]